MVRLRVRKGENGASLQAEIRGLPPFSNSANLSHLGFCRNTACESPYCSCIGALDSVILGPIVAFSANSGSTICNEAPLWRFLPTSSAARFRWFRLGFSRALLRRALARLWFGAFLRRIAARDSRESFAQSFATVSGQRSATKTSRLRLGRASFRNENFALAFGAGHRLATKPRVCGSVNIRPALNDGVSRSRPRRLAVSGVE